MDAAGDIDWQRLFAGLQRLFACSCVNVRRLRLFPYERFTGCEAVPQCGGSVG